MSLYGKEESFLNFAKNQSPEILRRMNDHIESQKKNGEDPARITISPIQIARIMGHTDIAEKLQNSMSSILTFSLFNGESEPLPVSSVHSSFEIKIN